MTAPSDRAKSPPLAAHGIPAGAAESPGPPSRHPSAAPELPHEKGWDISRKTLTRTGALTERNSLSGFGRSMFGRAQGLLDYDGQIKRFLYYRAKEQILQGCEMIPLSPVVTPKTAVERLLAGIPRESKNTVSYRLWRRFPAPHGWPCHAKALQTLVDSLAVQPPVPGQRLARIRRERWFTQVRLAGKTGKVHY